ncbi:MAG: outer membrane protein assembly factor BamE [Gammaproteobacteria bacterium]|nr:outer membrane protein assembly factor BamE [Gammaproteobacteria bacterium]
MTNRYRTILWGTLAGASCLAPAWGSQLTHLRTEVRTLRAQVRHLERRLGACVAGRPAASGPATPAPETAPATPPGAQKARPAPGQPLGPPPQTRTSVWRLEWRQLRRQMTKPQVRALLGTPTRAVTLGSQRVWYYSYGRGDNGSVAFGANGRLLAWQAPPFGSWW